MSRVALSLAAAVFLTPAAVSAQLSSQVSEVDDGVVRFTYEARPGVEICDQGVRIGDHQIRWRFEGSRERESNCRTGDVEVELRVRDGQVRDVELVTAIGERHSDGVDLGRISPVAASQYLLSLIYNGATDDAAEDAVFPAMLADAPDAWRGLLDIARDRDVPEGARKNTLFWLGQEAAEAATRGLADVALDEAEEQGIRDAAIFALSQRPDGESIPVLMELARDGEEAETRKTAMFWLAQSDDPRVIQFFEELLVRGLR
jgi:hypothetical protein